MSRKPKISTDGAPTLSSNPFAALGGALGDLPPGEATEPSPPEPKPKPVGASAGGASTLRGKIVVRREKKGRGGKTATVIEGLSLRPAGLTDMAKRMRRSFGCGAKVEGETIVLTGTLTERVRDWLLAEGATRVVIGN